MFKGILNFSTVQKVVMKCKLDRLLFSDQSQCGVGEGDWANLKMSSSSTPMFALFIFHCECYVKENTLFLIPSSTTYMFLDHLFYHPSFLSIISLSLPLSSGGNAMTLYITAHMQGHISRFTVWTYHLGHKHAFQNTTSCPDPSGNHSIR